MKPENLSSIFIKTRAKKGDEIAKQFITSADYQQVDLEIESLSMSLQMEFSRVQGTALHQINTKEVGDQLKLIVDNGINKIIDSILKDESLYLDFLKQLRRQNRLEMSEDAKDLYDEIKNINLSYDFSQIVWNIKDFAYKDVIRLLKVLIISTILRRFQRRSLFGN